MREKKLVKITKEDNFLFLLNYSKVCWCPLVIYNNPDISSVIRSDNFLNLTFVKTVIKNRKYSLNWFRCALGSNLDSQVIPKLPIITSDFFHFLTAPASHFPNCECHRSNGYVRCQFILQFLRLALYLADFLKIILLPNRNIPLNLPFPTPFNLAI